MNLVENRINCCLLYAEWKADKGGGVLAPLIWLYRCLLRWPRFWRGLERQIIRLFRRLRRLVSFPCLARTWAGTQLWLFRRLVRTLSCDGVTFKEDADYVLGGTLNQIQKYDLEWPNRDSFPEMWIPIQYESCLGDNCQILTLAFFYHSDFSCDMIYCLRTKESEW